VTLRALALPGWARSSILGGLAALLAAALLALPGWAQASFEGRVTRVVDCDTIEVDLILSLVETPAGPIQQSALARVRLEGVLAPEVRGAEAPLGRACATTLRARLPVGAAVVFIPGDRRAEKFGRWLGRIEHDGADIGAWLLDSGLAARSGPGGRKP
jgi:endonuclease YncB( thermonuclease family)